MDSDALHEVGSHREWSESFYFNFYDKRSDICGFMRIGLKPNKNEKSLFCYLLMSDGSILKQEGTDVLDSADLNVRGLRFEKIIPEKRWRLVYSGIMKRQLVDESVKPENVSFAIDFECLNTPFDYRECVSGIGERISAKVGSEHFEQFGSAKGSLTVGVAEHAVNGLGERDHSWGVRDWAAPKMWTWLTCQFSESSALNVTKLVMDAGEINAGFIHIAGKNVPLLEVHIDMSRGKNGYLEGLVASLEDKNGEVHNVRADMMRRAVLSFVGADSRTQSVMEENLARYSMDSSVGYGIAEYLMRRTSGPAKQ